MTEQVFLAGIKLSQFRSFGELDIKLPTEPGVLIVYGSNGLGKSSLFDGLEWALTDGIDHFRDARGADKVGKYLSRWRENPTGRTSVAMTFSDGAVVERSIASASSTESILEPVS
jgi:exonuclease SbcC